LYRYRLDDSFSDGLTGAGGDVLDVLLLVRRNASPAWAIFRRRGVYFEKMLGYANHLGLYGEELGPRERNISATSPGLHAPGTDQRRLRSRPPSLDRGYAA